MTDQEINEKIARWCGVELELDLGELMDSEVEVYRIPNFLDPIKGLGLLFKYAVPKLDGCHVDYLKKRTDKTAKPCFATAWIKRKKNTAVEDEDPTRALAMAIVKLIEEDSNGNA